MKHTQGERKLKRQLQLQEQQGLEHLLAQRENERWCKIFQFSQEKKVSTYGKHKRRGGLEL